MTSTTLLIALVLTVLYFLPAMIALSRNHANLSAITVTNLLLGWTCFGWIGAMVWAHTNNVKERPAPTK